jgi:hypothetical protein
MHKEDSLNLTQMSENQLSPLHGTNNQQETDYSNEYNSDNMLQLSPINTSTVNQHLNTSTENSQMTTDNDFHVQATSLESDDTTNIIEPRNLNNIFPDHRNNSPNDHNYSKEGNLETQGPGRNT